MDTATKKGIDAAKTACPKNCRSNRRFDWK